jgi:L-alanine-DL-glutamate epimerase-like enolase superfamily enzyme
MWWRVHYGGRGGLVSLAVSAVDIALWDLNARRAGAPLWRHPGGHDPRVPCYAGGIDLDFPLDALLRQTDENLARGFRAIKMKVGRSRLTEDVERVRAMRRHLGPDVPLMVDANMRWSADEAGGLPVATGENLHTLHEFTHMIAAGGVTFREPDVTNCGGITVFMKVAHLAEAFNLPVTSHGAHDLTVHLLAAVPNRSYLEAHGFGLDRFLRHPLRLEDGMAVAPERPGHGVELDWAGLETLRAS